MLYTIINQFLEVGWSTKHQSGLLYITVKNYATAKASAEASCEAGLLTALERSKLKATSLRQGMVDLQGEGNILWMVAKSCTSYI